MAINSSEIYMQWEKDNYDDNDELLGSQLIDS